jgi:hypothetical protein
MVPAFFLKRALASKKGMTRPGDVWVFFGQNWLLDTN